MLSSLLSLGWRHGVYPGLKHGDSSSFPPGHWFVCVLKSLHLTLRERSFRSRLTFFFDVTDFYIHTKRMALFVAFGGVIRICFKAFVYFARFGDRYYTYIYT